MEEATQIELNRLLQELEKDPTNLDLLNSIAIGYFDNINQKSDKEDFDYFQKAYQLKKTVKSTHNFAWFLYFEWAEIEWRWNQNGAIQQAFEIQKECIQLNPKSFFPYYLLGYMLLDQGKFGEAISYLQQAYKLEKRRDILHNIGCCHFHLQQLQQAKSCFEEAAKVGDTENISLFNLAITAWKLDSKEEAKRVIDQLAEGIQRHAHTLVSGYEIGNLYFLLEDYQKAVASLMAQGITGIAITDWPALSYALYKSNLGLWQEQLTKLIIQDTELIVEIEKEDACDGFSKEEKKERQLELKDALQKKQNMLEKGMIKPIPTVSNDLVNEFCGCLLFDCPRHGNRKND